MAVYGINYQGQLQYSDMSK